MRSLHGNHLFCVNSRNVWTGHKVIAKFAVCSAESKWTSEINFRPICGKSLRQAEILQVSDRNDALDAKESAPLPFPGCLTAPSQAWRRPFLANQLLASLSTLFQLSRRREVDLDLRSHLSSSQHWRHYPSLAPVATTALPSAHKNNIFINSLLYCWRICFCFFFMDAWRFFMDKWSVTWICSNSKTPSTILSPLWVVYLWVLLCMTFSKLAEAIFLFLKPAMFYSVSSGFHQISFIACILFPRQFPGDPELRSHFPEWIWMFGTECRRFTSPALCSSLCQAV